MTNDKFKPTFKQPFTPQTETRIFLGGRPIDQQVEQISSKRVSKQHYQSARVQEINPGYGPASEVTITSSDEIAFISSQKYGKSSWKRTQEPGEGHGHNGSTKEGDEWQTQTLSAGVFGEKEIVELLLQKLENGEIKVRKKTMFYVDCLTNSFYYISQHETAESRRLKEEVLKAFRENVETREKLLERQLELAKTNPLSILFPSSLSDADREKIRGTKKI